MNPLIETLIEGFSEDPLFTYAFADRALRERLFPRLFAGVLRHAERHGGVVQAGDGAAVAAWVPDTKMSVSIFDALHSGMIGLPVRAGPKAWRRFSGYEQAADRHTEAAHGSGFAYLWVVAARTSRRGEGLGRLVVERAQRDMRAKGHATCVLRTQNPRNVGLYRHLGFEESSRFTPAGSGPETVTFRRSLLPATETVTRHASA